MLRRDGSECLDTVGEGKAHPKSIRERDLPFGAELALFQLPVRVYRRFPHLSELSGRNLWESPPAGFASVVGQEPSERGHQLRTGSTAPPASPLTESDVSDWLVIAQRWLSHTEQRHPAARRASRRAPFTCSQWFACLTFLLAATMLSQSQSEGRDHVGGGVRPVGATARQIPCGLLCRVRRADSSSLPSLRSRHVIFPRAAAIATRCPSNGGIALG